MIIFQSFYVTLKSQTKLFIFTIKINVMLIGTFKTIVNELYDESLNITFMKIKKYIYICQKN